MERGTPAAVGIGFPVFGALSGGGRHARLSDRGARFVFVGCLLLLASVLFCACSKDKEPDCPHSARVLLVYMAGDNNLSGYVQDNLDGIAAGMASAPAGSRTLVYLDTPGENPRLVEVASSGVVTRCTWPSPQNSASAEMLREVIGRVRALAPADRYGLVLWSHGLAWMPSWATGYLTRSKALTDYWPATKHGEAASETSAGFAPAFAPDGVFVPVAATGPAPVTGTGFASEERFIRPTSVPRSATELDEASGTSVGYLPPVIPSAAVPAFFGNCGSAPTARLSGRTASIPVACDLGSLTHSFSATGIAPAISAPCLAAFPAPALWPRTKWFGQDTGANPHGYIETEELASAIPAGVFDYILFDACFMASAEVLYALRDRAEWFVASPTEVIADGFPYERIISELLRPAPDLRAVCESYYRHYADDPRPAYRSAAVALVRASELEALADATASLLSTALAAGPAALSGMDLGQVQPLDRYGRHFLFDAGSVVGRLEALGLVPASLAAGWRTQLVRTVPYEAHTPAMLGLSLDECCGLSMYVPVSAYADLNEYYKTLGWYARCYPAAFRSYE